MVKLVRVSGYSNSGKTTLVTALVEKLTGQGVGVATLKHHGGKEHIEATDTDTWKHRKAGASASFLISSDSMTIYDDSDQGTRIGRAVGLCPPDVELVILEGFKTFTGIPWIAVRREGFELVPIDGDELPLCIVTDETDVDTDIPVFNHSDVDRVVKLLADKLLGGGE